ncbi:hypothetical protein, partial [Stenotrophomonas maltophilia]|uniref:hypothetical protein n=1 Tax=Stenotrophomonas maltophilia TaxID=40324 RepID=UPI0019540AFE
APLRFADSFSTWLVEVEGLLPGVPSRDSTFRASVRKLVLRTPIDAVGPALALVSGEDLMESPNGVLKEVGADLVEHAYAASQTGDGWQGAD